MKKILVFNAGSSSIKFSLYEAGGGERLLYLGELSSIGSGEGMFSVRDGGGGLWSGRGRRSKIMPPHSVMFFPGSLRMRWCNPTSLATAWCMEDRFILRPHCLPRSLFTIFTVWFLMPLNISRLPLGGGACRRTVSRCGAGGLFRYGIPPFDA